MEKILKSFILSLSSVTPKTHFSQKNVAKTFERSLNLNQNEAKKLHQVFQNTCIETRYSVLKDYGSSSLQGTFFGDNFPTIIPDTYQRNQVYIQESPKLAIRSSQKALNQWDQPLYASSQFLALECMNALFAEGSACAIVGFDPEKK